MKNQFFGAQGPQKCIFGARGIPGGSPQGIPGALWADWPWAMGRWALRADGPFGPIGPLDLGPWAQGHGPMCPGAKALAHEYFDIWAHKYF